MIAKSPNIITGNITIAKAPVKAINIIAKKQNQIIHNANTKLDILPLQFLVKIIYASFLIYDLFGANWIT